MERNVRLLQVEEELNAQHCIEQGVSTEEKRVHQYKQALERALESILDDNSTLYQDICAYLYRIKVPSFIKKKAAQQEAELDEPKFYLYAYIDKNTWSNIRLEAKRISKESALKLVIALQLTEKEAKELVKKASYALSRTDYRDHVIIALLHIQCYDPDEASEILEVLGKNKKHPFENIYII
ncbi:hypothetical protein C0033_13265 [Clostridium sp. chh4-2]|uniref:hypothetical protein n=1 Tax=Clostridium sp. chh4-2 TaxID=2067550 RepID=UPI000CCF3AE2|nr:hypothetical protein [Clostridium sp. chh4-2]PNV61547.1 hypothetical protein C0033_13265 [Clostridium sp. chh4-2]